MKDPAVLLYFDKWITSTNGMKAEFRAWYMDLIIYQYDKGKIPMDVDELAGICRVRPSEYQAFNQMVDQVVKQKFVERDGFYYNDITSEVLRKREDFVQKRTLSSNIGVVIKIARSMKSVTEAQIDFIKEFLKDKTIEEINTYKSNQMVNHLVNLYINEDEDVNKDEKEKRKGVVGEKPKPAKTDLHHLIDRFNEKCKNLPNVIKLTNPRKAALENRIEEYDINQIEVVFEMVSESEFLNGNNDRGWKANFDWIMNPTNFTKILEGTYKNKQNGNRNNNNQRTDAERKQSALTAAASMRGFRQPD